MKSAKTAWAVTAVVILLSAVLGCNRSLASESGRVRQMIVTGDEHGYCIATDYQDMVNVARNLMTVGKKYLPAGDPLFARLEEACARTPGERSSSREWVEATRDLRAGTDALIEKLEKTGALTEKDMGYLFGFATDLKSAMHRMESDPYNAAARAFNQVEGSFPARLLGFLVEPLECFSF